MNDDQKDKLLKKIETRHEIVAAICREDGSDTHEDLWYALGKHANQGLCLWVVTVDGEPYAVLSKKPLSEQGAKDWAAAMALEIDE